MCGRATSVLLLLLLSLPSDAQFQCPWTARYSGQFRTTALDVSVDGPFVWLATGYGVQLLDQSKILDSVAIPGLTRVIESDGTGLAYAGSGARVYVLQREGNRIRVLRSFAASGTVNDIAAVNSYLLVATSNGIDHFDPLDTKTNAFLATSSPNVTSLAIDRATLYAADGDTSLEMFSIANPSIPQGAGSLDTVRASSVHVMPQGLVLASDNLGRNTDLFAGTERLARMPFATTSFAFSSQGHFVAGPDRTLRAVDLSTPSRVAELMEMQFPPTDGSDNSIHAIERSGNTLYVAAGDIGLAVIDVSTIAKPWPLVSYATGATNGVRVAGDKAWFSDASGRIWEENLNTNGLALSDVRDWAAGAGSLVRDVQDTTLLTSSGSVVTAWSLGGTTPAPAISTTFATNVSNAVAGGAGIVVLLVDGSLWRVQPSAPAKVSVPKIALLARSGAAIALAEVNAQSGSTTIHYYATGDVTAEPRRFTIDGTPVGNMALSATRAAIFTFKGISVVDLVSGTVSVATDSNRLIPRQLALAGNTLLAADGRTLLVYENAKTLVREHALPASVVALDATSATAVMATNEGMAATTFLGRLPQPHLPFRSSFYTKLAAGNDRIYLFSDDGIDVFRTASSEGLEHITGIPAQGIIDVAATDSALFALGGNGAVASYSRAGASLAQVTLDEGTDAQPLSIDTAGNAVWVSFAKGCTSGTCEKKTLVLDPASLAVTASMTGGIDDVVANGPRAYALVNLPSEIRVVNLTDPLHPAVLVAAPRPASAKSIAAGGGKVYVLGDRVLSYAESSLATAGEFLAAIPANDTSRIRIEGNCAIVSGRSENAETYRLPDFSADRPHTPMPSAMLSFALQPGRVVFLTGHSIELWASVPANTPSKRRSMR